MKDGPEPSGWDQGVDYVGSRKVPLHHASVALLGEIYRRTDTAGCLLPADSTYRCLEGMSGQGDPMKTGESCDIRSNAS